MYFAVIICDSNDVICFCIQVDACLFKMFC